VFHFQNGTEQAANAMVTTPTTAGTENINQKQNLFKQ
jgi:hypothetical protein